MQITVTDNFPDVKRMLGEQQGQMPFALALAITRTAQDVQKAERDEMGSVFDRPTRYTLNSLFLKRATKQTLEARVWLKDYYEPNFLLPQIEGGARRQKRFEQLLVQRGAMASGERAVPGEGASLDTYGNMSRGQIVKILSQVKAFNLAGANQNASGSKRSKARRSREEYFISTGKGAHPRGRGAWKGGQHAQHLPRGIWVRTSFGAWGTAVKPVLLFVSRATYRVRFRFFDVANTTVARVLPGHIQSAVAHALNTARPAKGAA